MLKTVEFKDLKIIFDLYLSNIYEDVDIFGFKYSIKDILKTLDTERYDELFYIWYCDMIDTGVIIKVEGG